MLPNGMCAFKCTRELHYVDVWKSQHLSIIDYGHGRVFGKWTRTNHQDQDHLESRSWIRIRSRSPIVIKVKDAIGCWCRFHIVILSILSPVRQWYPGVQNMWQPGSRAARHFFWQALFMNKCK